MMTDEEVREHTRKGAEFLESIKQEPGESWAEFLDRNAKLLGWGSGNDVITGGKLEKG